MFPEGRETTPIPIMGIGLPRLVNRCPNAKGQAFSVLPIDKPTLHHSQQDFSRYRKQALRATRFFPHEVPVFMIEVAIVPPKATFSTENRYLVQTRGISGQSRGLACAFVPALASAQAPAVAPSGTPDSTVVALALYIGRARPARFFLPYLPVSLPPSTCP